MSPTPVDDLNTAVPAVQDPAEVAEPAAPAPADTRPARRARIYSAATVALVTCTLGGLYLWRAMVAPVPLHRGADPESTSWLGMDRWAFLGRPWALAFVTLAVLAGVAVARWPMPIRRAAIAGRAALDRTWVRAALAAASVIPFWLTRNHQENLDGSLLQQKIAAGVAANGSFVTHDEMLELYLHSRLWEMLNSAWGWDVAHTYRVVSCLAGGVAVYLALGLIRRFPPTRWPFVVLGLFAGGWVLIFFGDVENYTLTNVVVLAYLTAALRFLDENRDPDPKGGRLWPVGLILGVATLCHLEALVLAPSLLVLLVVAYRRGRRLDAALAAGAGPMLLAAALWFFDHHGLPISNLTTHSQISAQGGHFGAFLSPPSPDYIWMQLQLLLLLAPAVTLLPALLVGASRPRGPYSLFLGVAAAGPILLVMLWRAQLGEYEDWNLYAIAAPPLGLFVFGALAMQKRIGRQAPWLVAALVLMASQSLAWVLEHHLLVR